MVAPLLRLRHFSNFGGYKVQARRGKDLPVRSSIHGATKTCQRFRALGIKPCESDLAVKIQRALFGDLDGLGLFVLLIQGGR